MKAPSRPSLGSSAKRGSRRRRPVVDPQTQKPVKKEPTPQELEESAALEQTDSDGAEPTQPTAPVDHTLMDRLEEQEFLRRHRRNIRLATLSGIGAGLLVVVYVVFFSPLFAYRISDCKVGGAKAVDAATICQATAPFAGIPLTRLPAAKVEHTILEKVPALEKVAARRLWPGGLELAVMERIPVATVRQNGKIVGVDHQGVVLEVAPGQVGGLPRLDVDLEKLGGKTQKLVTSSLHALGDMPQELRSSIAAVTSQDPVLLSFSMRDGRTLVWGDTSDGVLKAQLAKTLFTVQGVKVVDVSNPKTPSTR